LKIFCFCLDYYSGVHLKDIISLHVALQDRLEYDLINFRKLVQLNIVFRTLTNVQVSLPPIQPNHDLIHLLTVRKNFHREQNIFVF
jgi:hypothetical protein